MNMKREDVVQVEASTSHYQPERDALMQMLVLARQHWRELGKATLLGLAVGLVVAFAIPNYYTASVRLMPPENGNPASILSSLAAGKALPASMADLAGTMAGLKNAGPVYIRVLSSRTVEDAVIWRHDLRSVYWRKHFETARKKLESRTEVSEDKKSGVIEIAVTDSDRERAKAMAQTYVDEANKLLASVSTSAARRERIFIEKRLSQAEGDLYEAERRLSEFSAKNTALDVKEQTKAMVSAGADLQAKIIAARSELEGLQQTYTPNNVRVRALRARIAELERELSKLSGVPGMENATELYPPLRKLPQLGAQWADLYRNAQVQEKLFELLTQQCELAKIQEAREIPVLNELDAPVLPERKSWPPRGLIIFGSCGAVLSGSFLRVWIRNFLAAQPQHESVVRIKAYLAVLRRPAVLPTSRATAAGK